MSASADPVIVATDLGFPEGPYEHPDGFLLVQEPTKSKISLVRSDGTTETFVDVPGAGTGGIVFNRAGYAFATGGGQSRKLFRITPQRELEVFLEQFEGEPLLGPNDLAMHPSGHIFFSDPGLLPTGDLDGAFYRTDFEGHVVRVAQGLGYPNGVAVSPDGSRVYLAETETGLVHAFDVDAAGNVSARSVLADVGRGTGEGGPDGMCVDEKGNVYVAVYSSGVVRVISPDGTQLYDIPAGGASPTNCCFGGPGRRTLYITETETSTLRAVANDIPGAPPVLP